MFGYDGRSPPLINQLTRSRMYENVPYVAPRFLPAILGVATVPICFALRVAARQPLC